ncbi:hypothetical protein LG322_02555 [Microbacterium aerolatum]|uniref:Uncharacterized protein n=1 Tax=Microbacterium aerolatum TaxID=153731 RepID=A0A511AB72_9MICO|nr:hypothetical protein [Microbacterium aerolatum]MCK3768631.1 hypothetical protein [Microbacterium aerolatum]GEK85420.1 hypothetical protein MAE01_05960 [Microbacterium aerolatum]GGB30972.1 hypothetical protein GCM10007198_21770 [Microbacterium aerolatum]
MTNLEIVLGMIALGFTVITLMLAVPLAVRARPIRVRSTFTNASSDRVGADAFVRGLPAMRPNPGMPARHLER